MSNGVAAAQRRGHGLLPHVRDKRDLPHPLHAQHADPPSSVDLSTWREMPEVWDQGSLDSCVPHAVAAAWEFAARKSGEQADALSRLFIWYEGRALDGLATTADTGIHLRTALKVLFTTGAPPEQLWPYVIENFDVRPTEAAYAAASQHKAQNYFLVKPARQQTLLDRLRAILADGLPICFGMQYFESFGSAATTGEVPMPSAAEQADGSLGLHAALLVGYDDTAQCFKARNSYGADWGPLHGYFTIPYEYVSSPWAGPDFWTVRIAV